jgi:hypothetical protein
MPKPHTGDAHVNRNPEWVATLGLTLLAACSHGPPPDFAPDPGLVSRIHALEMRAPSTACPGYSIPVTYTAILDNGSHVPFSNRYDKKHPPRLHVMFLERTSDEATPLEDGGWATERDPLYSAQTGFHLHAALSENPAIADSATLAPIYDCLPHVFRFSGRTGGHGHDGGDGPDVIVRLAWGHSRFYDRLIVASVAVGEAPPFYVLADPDRVPPRDWLVVESRGGAGGIGEAGAAGWAGTAGVEGGCPGKDGKPGANGHDGGPGADGGRGGRITIIAPEENPFLAGLVDARTPGGDAGAGGPGGTGGVGGAAGKAGTNPREGSRCLDGHRGSDGHPGAKGPPGREGLNGHRPTVLTVPSRDVFGTVIPPEVRDLLEP